MNAFFCFMEFLFDECFDISNNFKELKYILCRIIYQTNES